MKNMRKIASLVLALVMVFAMATTAFAATITIRPTDNVAVTGKTFSAYKILDMSIVEGTDSENNPIGYYVYTVPAALKNAYATRYSIDVNDTEFDVKVVNAIDSEMTTADNKYEVAQELLQMAISAGVTPVTGKVDGENYVFTEVDAGYYIISDDSESGTISALIVDSVDGEYTVTIKADQPTIDKKIFEDADNDQAVDNGELVDANTAGVGETVNYYITSEVPVMTGYTSYTYTITDTLSSGLTYNQDSLKVTIDGVELVKGTDYTLTVTPNGTTGETVLVINFIDFIDYNTDAAKGDAIVVTYGATVNDKAVIGVAGNPNKVNLKYSNNPNDNSDFETTPDSITKTYVTEIEIKKIDPFGQALTGAEFAISGNGVQQILVATLDAQGNVTDVTVKNLEQDKTEITAVVDESGILRIQGLHAGNYTITETKAPAGYNKLDNPIDVTISCVLPDAVDSGVEECTWTYSATGATAETSEDGLFQITVVNQGGQVLPETGGMGTTLFYLVGGILVVAAVVLLVTKKRMAAAE